MNFLHTFLSTLMINKFQSNGTKFHKSLYAEMGKLGGFKCIGVQDRALKLCPVLRTTVSVLEIVFVGQCKVFVLS